ncbi:IS630 transposase-related protein [Allofrancisella frigidaquae]|uniref:Transposase n=1 Tax=Allofrancisella frigidaquae TaxID=1085644 RepID=A0A6M3HX05_9GAMM|nr:IS630 transposase-related protein [Allofrancisella frigidaquae]QIV94812.1 transposase [Allofrancisella frigidaquae]
MTYSLDFRKKVLSIKKSEGLTYQATADRFKIGKNSVYLWSKQINSKVTKSRPEIKLTQAKLLDDVRAYPDDYQYERAQRLGVSQSCICYALQRLEITCKKRLIATLKQILLNKRILNLA